MKKLILGMAGLLLFAILTKAQQPAPSVVTGRGLPAPIDIKMTVQTPVVTGVKVNMPAPTANINVAPTYAIATKITGIGTTIPSPPSMVNVNVSPVYAVTPIIASGVTTTVDANVTATYNWSDQQDQADDPMKSKTFSKSFSIDRNDKLNLTNQFGSITIKTWSKNEIKVDGDIKAYASTESEAQALLDQANITGSKDGDMVNFKTNFSELNGNWGNGSRNGKRWRREIKVNLTVYMPAYISLTLTNKHGNITMDDFSGPTAIRLEFGSLTAGNLTNSNNYISVKYGKTTLQDVNQATIKQEFGDGLTLSNIGTIDLNAHYARVTIGAIKGNATIKQRFGNGLTIGSLNELDLDAQYVNVKLGTLKGNATIKTQFHKLAIEEIELGCKSLNLTSKYTQVNIGFNSKYNADFEVSTNHTGFNYGTNVVAKKQTDDDNRRPNFSPTYSGQIGKGGTANINVKAEFGQVSFNRE